jgi:hypothetical protein
MSRTTTSPKDDIISIRVGKHLADALDDGAMKLGKRAGAIVTRSQFVRHLLCKSLDLKTTTSLVVEEKK